MTRACAFRNARTDMRFRRGYADFAGGSRRARDVVAQIPGIRNLLPMVHSVRVGGWVVVVVVASSLCPTP